MEQVETNPELNSTKVKTGDKNMFIGITVTLTVVALLVGIILYFAFGKSGSKTSGDVIELDWRKLQELDIESGKEPSWFDSTRDKLVKMPGYAVPLEDDMREIREFLLVPDAQSCIHVPPPPPNMTVYVKMSKPMVYDSYQRAVWITGVLSIESTKNDVANASWKLKGVKMDPYVFED